MVDTVRCLNEKGIKEFSRYLENGAKGIPPFNILSSSETSEDLPWPVSIEHNNFSDRFEFGNYLKDAFKDCDQQAISHRKGLWSWLGLYYFDSICPLDTAGDRKVYKAYSYILSGEFRHYYRHFIRTPYILVRDHGMNSRVLLRAPLFKRGELIEQIASRQNIVGRKSVMEAIDQLYYDLKTDKPKRGVAGRAKPGTVDRLVGILQQFELTYDLTFINGNQILNLLPAEFARFRS